MAAYVPVPWVSPLLYAAVLVGGLYYTPVSYTHL